MFAPFSGVKLGPSWAFFEYKRAVLWGSALFFIALSFFYEFLALLAPSGSHFGSILRGFGLDVGSNFDLFCDFFETFSRRSGAGWAGGVTRSATNFYDMFANSLRRTGTGWAGGVA